MTVDRQSTYKQVWLQLVSEPCLAEYKTIRLLSDTLYFCQIMIVKQSTYYNNDQIKTFKRSSIYNLNTI